MSGDEQYVLDQLGVFIGSFSLPLALALLADERIHEWSALEHMSTLIEKSLVMVEPGRLLESWIDVAHLRAAAAWAMGPDGDRRPPSSWRATVWYAVVPDRRTMGGR